MLTLDKLRAISTIAANNFPALIDACDRYGIDTSLRVAHFIAQVAHESAAFSRTVENLNYSAQGLANVWPRRFAQDADTRPRVPNAEAVRLHRNPQAIANVVYADRLGNGDAASGDGWRFRGRGLIQLTGRSNVLMFSRRHFGDDRLLRNPELLQSDPLASISAADYWARRDCNVLADADDLHGVTRRINGGLNGLDDRRRWLGITKEALGIGG